jgi:hypothetical protein
MARQASAGVRQSDGTWPLLPAQEWFFTKEFAFPNRWCNGFLLAVTRPVNWNLLREAIVFVISHHDGLRLRFRRNRQGWQQYVSSDEIGHVTRQDLSALGSEKQNALIKQLCSQIADSLNVDDSALLHVMFLELGPARGSRLLIVIHHLLIDSISLSIVLEDIETVYERLRQPRDIGETTPLIRTTSVLDWALDLSRRRAADTRIVPPSSSQPVTLSAMKPSVTATSGSAELYQRIDHTLVTELLAIKRKHLSGLNVLLLTALCRVLADLNAAHLLTVGIVINGRMPFKKSVDLSRTIGWLAAQVPLSFDIQRASPLTFQIRAVAAPLRSNLRGAIDGRTECFGGAYDNTGARGIGPEPDTSFNHAGDFDMIYGNCRMFRKAAEVTGMSYCSENAPPNPLSMSSWFGNGNLHVSWLYDTALFSKEVIIRIAKMLETEIGYIVLHG